MSDIKKWMKPRHYTDSPDAKIASVEKNVYETVATLNTDAGFKIWGTVDFNAMKVAFIAK